MARLLNDLAEDLSSERSGTLLADEFILGEPAPTRLELVRGEVVSVVELLRERRERRAEDEETPLVLALVKLAVFIGVTIAVTAVFAVGVGTAVVRAALGFVG